MRSSSTTGTKDGPDGRCARRVRPPNKMRNPQARMNVMLLTNEPHAPVGKGELCRLSVAPLTFRGLRLHCLAHATPEVPGVPSPNPHQHRVASPRSATQHVRLLAHHFLKQR